MSDPAKQPEAASVDTDGSSPPDGDSRRRRSSDEVAAVAPSPEMTPSAATDTIPAEDSRPQALLRRKLQQCEHPCDPRERRFTKRV